MSDDSFFREVNEELRSERMRGFWNLYGWMIISVVVLVITVTAGWGAYEYWQSRQAARSGDAFLAALTLADQGQTDEALAALDQLEAEGYGAYPVLARMRAATLMVEAGDAETAIAELIAIGEDGSAPVAIREASRLRAAYLLVDHGSYDEVLAVVNEMTGDDHPMRHSAREALGLAAWNADDLETAEEWFRRISSDGQALQGPAQRAEIMLELIAGTGPRTAPPAEGPPEADAPEESAPEVDEAAPEAPISLDSIAPALAPTAPEEGGLAPDADATDPPAPELAPLEPLEEESPS